MDALTRWKTIATIAVAFSAGSLIGIACQDAGKASADTAEDDSDGDGSDGGGSDGEDAGSSDGGGSDGGGDAPPPAGDSAGRAVFTLTYSGAGGAGQECVDRSSLAISGVCSCPAGFSPVGVSMPASNIYDMVCLED